MNMKLPNIEGIVGLKFVGVWLCGRCGNTWTGKFSASEPDGIKAPSVCASCRSDLWNVPRVRNMSGQISKRQG